MNESVTRMNEKREYFVIILSAIICIVSLLYDKSIIILSLGGCFYFFRTGSILLEEGSWLKRLYLACLVLTGISIALISGMWFSYLIIWFCIDNLFLEFSKNKNVFRCCFPVLIYIISITFLHSKKALHHIFFESAAIFAFVLVFTLIDLIYERHQRNICRLNSALGKSALIELEEKRLNQELAVKNYLIDRNARYEERERISRDIHNLVGHSITASIMALDAAELLYDKDPIKSKEKMFIAKERIQEGLSSIRHAVRLLDDFRDVIYLNDFVNSLIVLFSKLMMDFEIIIRHNLELIEDKLGDRYSPHRS